ncbi:MAG: SigE family RNA polymerase sigma factor [Micropruina sp.]|nr:SigE family RNA polymerase sigma factor [Micropruina sp.]
MVAPTFESYVAERSVALQRFAYLVTHNVEDARDLVQEALIGLYPRWASVAATGTVEAYVRRSIVNAGISRWRKVRRLTSVADPSELPWAPATADPALAIADADEAWRLCATLPPIQRAAVVMRFYEELSFTEIAEVLQIPPSTARSHVHRALATLRARLTKDTDDD